MDVLNHTAQPTFRTIKVVVSLNRPVEAGSFAEFADIFVGGESRQTDGAGPHLRPLGCERFSFKKLVRSLYACVSYVSVLVDGC
jgi:hypothetical protein